MNKEELAGNLFRLTLTEGRIDRDKVRGQDALEHIAESVGKRVRQTMIDETGVKPENLPIGPDIRQVRQGLKKTNRGFERLDDVASERKAEASVAASMATELELASSGIVPDCAECVAGVATSHYGSPQCTSGSLASGGNVAHCACDYCKQITGSR